MSHTSPDDVTFHPVWIRRLPYRGGLAGDGGDTTLARVFRLLFLADTHLGLPNHFPPFERALEPAFRGEADAVVHGGDVFYRSRVKPGLVMRAFEPLKRLADRGIPVVVVPGNHERSAIPYPMLAMHPGIHIFDRPRTFRFNLAGIDVAFSGFPNDRNNIRASFPNLVQQTGWQTAPADVRLLCLHQTVEGATVGPADFVFRGAPDVIPRHAIPDEFTAVLSGHIHRHQVLDAAGTPVFYPGSTERTSWAERNEAKGYLRMNIGASRIAWKFDVLSERIPGHAYDRNRFALHDHDVGHRANASTTAGVR